MSEQHQDQQATLDKWQVSTLRLTGFPSEPVEVQGWWEQLTGYAPNEQTRQRSGEFTEIGPYESGGLILTSVPPFRFDWRLVPLEENVPLGAFPSIESFPVALESFKALMLDWLAKRCPDLKRLAFGADLIFPVEDHTSGYRQLSSYLPGITLDQENSFDFLYQINRPRNSQVGGPTVRINRLSKWSVIKFGRTVMLPSGQLVQFPGTEQYYDHLELDMNTSPEFEGTFSRDLLPEIFEELVNMGNEIATKGDVP